MDLQYHKLNPSHALAWRSLMLEGTAEFPLGFLISTDEVFERAAAQEEQILSEGRYRGITLNSELIAICGLRQNSIASTRHYAEIGPFYVSKYLHGQGVANFMMNEVVAEARDKGASRLGLWVDAENHRAIRFYEKFGFEKEAEIPDTVFLQEKLRVDYLYMLKI